MENKEIQNISLEDLFNNIKFISNEITIKYKCENDKIIITPIKNKENIIIYNSLFAILNKPKNKKIIDIENINICKTNICIKSECIFDLSKSKNKNIYFNNLNFIEKAIFILPDNADFFLNFENCIFKKEFEFGKENKIIFNKKINFKNCEFKYTFDIFNIEFVEKVSFDNVKCGTNFKNDLSSLYINILFKNIKFKNSLIFKKCSFYSITYFSEINFLDNTSFINSKFFRSFAIEKCEFMKTAEFTFVTFLNSIMFNYLKFHGNVIFTNALMCYDISLMDVLFKDAQSVQFAGLVIATDFKTIENKINNYAIKDLHYNKINIASIIQDSFRIIKDILITQHNILLATSWGKLELYTNEILLKKELEINKLENDIEKLENEEDQLKYKKQIEIIKTNRYSKILMRFLLLFYRKTSDHHTDLFKIIKCIIILLGYFSLTLFFCKYGTDLKLFFDNHNKNEILQIIYNFTPNLIINNEFYFILLFGFIAYLSFCFYLIIKVIAIIKLKYRKILNFCFNLIIMFIGIIGTCILIITNPKYIFGIANLFNPNQSYSGLENIIITIYSILAILFMYSLQKTARQKSIISN